MTLEELIRKMDKKCGVYGSQSFDLIIRLCHGIMSERIKELEAELECALELIER